MYKRTITTIASLYYEDNMKKNKKIETITLTIFSCVIIFLGILSGIEFAKGMNQLYTYEILNDYPSTFDYEHNLSLITMEFGFMIFLFWMGGNILITQHLPRKNKKKVSLERKKT